MGRSVVSIRGIIGFDERVLTSALAFGLRRARRRSEGARFARIVAGIRCAGQKDFTQ
jgi:hypothetical protein